MRRHKSGSHAGTAFTVHDSTLVGNDGLHEDGIENAQEEAGSVEAAQHIEDGDLACAAEEGEVSQPISDRPSGPAQGSNFKFIAGVYRQRAALRDVILRHVSKIFLDS